MIYLPIYLFIYLFIHSFIIYLFTYSSIQLCIHFFVCLFMPNKKNFLSHPVFFLVATYYSNTISTKCFEKGV